MWKVTEGVERVSRSVPGVPGCRMGKGETDSGGEGERRSEDRCDLKELFCLDRGTSRKTGTTREAKRGLPVSQGGCGGDPEVSLRWKKKKKL